MAAAMYSGDWPSPATMSGSGWCGLVAAPGGGGDGSECGAAPARTRSARGRARIGRWRGARGVRAPAGAGGRRSWAPLQRGRPAWAARGPRRRAAGPGGTTLRPEPQDCGRRGPRGPREAAGRTPAGAPVSPRRRSPRAGWRTTPGTLWWWPDAEARGLHADAREGARAIMLLAGGVRAAGGGARGTTEIGVGLNARPRGRSGEGGRGCRVPRQQLEGGDTRRPRPAAKRGWWRGAAAGAGIGRACVALGPAPGAERARAPRRRTRSCGTGPGPSPLRAGPPLCRARRALRCVHPSGRQRELTAGVRPSGMPRAEAVPRAEMSPS
jgi:hypothetical protein